MKKTVENKASDIQLIQKYLNGELDARAMHKLERRAQDDPFLMDALEGYGAAKGNQQDNLAALQTRLQARTATKVRRMTPWMVTAVAASVIGFAVVIGLLYNTSNKQTPQVAMNQPAKTKPVDTTPVTIDKQAETVITQPQKQKNAFQKPSAAVKRRLTPNRPGAAPANIQGLSIAQADIQQNTPPVSVLEEIVGSDIVAAKKQDTVLGGEIVAINKNASSLTVLKSKTEGATMTTRPGKATDNNPSALANAGLPPNLMAGVVINKKDALPLQDRSGKTPVKADAENQANASGYLANSYDKKEASGLVNNSSIGTKSFRGRDSAEQYKGSPALAEVVVVDNRNSKRSLNARPLVGWDNYKKYVQQQAVSTDGTIGAVELKATINANGSIAAVIITKSLSAIADAKAVNIIQNGPAWVGNTSGKVEDVKIRVEFHK